MKIIILISIISTILSAQNLAELIKQAEKNNEIIHSKNYIKESKVQEFKSEKNGYFPTIDIGGFYKREDDVSAFQAGDIYGAYAKAKVNLYDGGKRSSTIKAKKAQIKSLNYNTAAFSKLLMLEISKDFFTIKTLESSLKAQIEEKNTLKAQLKRVKQFYNVKMTTADNVARVQSDVDISNYRIETIKYKILQIKSLLELKVGNKVTKLIDSKFKKVLNNKYQNQDIIKALSQEKKSIIYNANAVKSYYYPHITLEDQYNLYSYDRVDPALKHLASPLKNQNKLMISANMRIFDFGSIKEKQEAIKISAKALRYKIDYQTKEQKIKYKLAVERIKTIKLKIKSAKSALNAAKIAFDTIEKKYNAGIVDYIVYLNALTKKTTSKALYEASLNDLEIAYANYYYYSGQNILKELK